MRLSHAMAAVALAVVVGMPQGLALTLEEPFTFEIPILSTTSEATATGLMQYNPPAGLSDVPLGRLTWTVEVDAHYSIAAGSGNVVYILIIDSGTLSLSDPAGNSACQWQVQALASTISNPHRGIKVSCPVARITNPISSGLAYFDPLVPHTFSLLKSVTGVDPVQTVLYSFVVHVQGVRPIFDPLDTFTRAAGISGPGFAALIGTAIFGVVLWARSSDPVVRLTGALLSVLVGIVGAFLWTATGWLPWTATSTAFLLLGAYLIYQTGAMHLLAAAEDKG